MGTWETVGKSAAAGLTAFGEGMTGGSRSGASDKSKSDLEAAVAKVQQASETTKQSLLDKQRKMRPQLGRAQAPANPEDIVMPGAPGRVSGPYSLKKGGRIKKTGVYRLHRGEFVLPEKVVKRLDKSRKAPRKSGRR